MAKLRFGTVGDDNLAGSLIDENIMFGFGGNDTLTGGNLTDVLYGGDGDDELNGLGGADLLYGGRDDDKLSGGAGRDLLVGGAGADTLSGGAFDGDVFAFLVAGDSRPDNHDTVTDFREHVDTVAPPPGTFEDTALHDPDTIALTLIDANTNARGNQAFAFAGEGADAVANSVTWHYDAGNTIVQADVNGDATADFEIVLTGLHSLTQSDFLL
jgi:Ca2+-binding RTX toxin-like protein